MSFSFSISLCDSLRHFVPRRFHGQTESDNCQSSTRYVLYVTTDNCPCVIAWTRVFLHKTYFFAKYEDISVSSVITIAKVSVFCGPWHGVAKYRLKFSSSGDILRRPGHGKVSAMFNFLLFISCLFVSLISNTWPHDRIIIIPFVEEQMLVSRCYLLLLF